jgi:hypothetical protein
VSASSSATSSLPPRPVAMPRPRNHSAAQNLDSNSNSSQNLRHSADLGSKGMMASGVDSVDREGEDSFDTSGTGGTGAGAGGRQSFSSFFDSSAATATGGRDLGDSLMRGEHDDLCSCGIMESGSPLHSCLLIPHNFNATPSPPPPLSLLHLVHCLFRQRPLLSSIHRPGPSRRLSSA